MRRFIASWFGSGLLLRRIRGHDLGSGTVAAAVTFPVALFVGAQSGLLGQVVATILVVATSLWATAPFVGQEGDAGWIVVDEAAGTFVALLGLGLSAASIVAFLVFRSADIFKTRFPGVARVEALGGPVGVTADDLVAGLYGLVAGHLVRILL